MRVVEDVRVPVDTAVAERPHENTTARIISSRPAPRRAWARIEWSAAGAFSSTTSQERTSSSTQTSDQGDRHHEPAGRVVGDLVAELVAEAGGRHQAVTAIRRMLATRRDRHGAEHQHDPLARAGGCGPGSSSAVIRVTKLRSIDRPLQARATSSGWRRP